MSLNLILVRHGESEMNKLGLHQGQLHDSRLSKRGKEQARELGESLKSEGIAKIFSSDLLRARETAKIVSKYLGVEEINLDERLREFSMGDFDKFPEKRNLLFYEFNKEELEKGKSKYDIRPPNGENIWDLIKRARDFLDDVEKLEGTILVVAHGGFNEALLNVVQDLDKDNFKRYGQENACINKLVFENGRWSLVSINGVFHLKSLEEPEKEVYENQEKIRNEVYREVSGKLNDFGIREAYIFGTINSSDFGRYFEKFGRHRGSVLNVLAFVEDFEIPEKWFYLGEKEIGKCYEIGNYKVGEVKHKIDLFLVKKNADSESEIENLGLNLVKLDI